MFFSLLKGLVGVVGCWLRQNRAGADHPAGSLLAENFCHTTNVYHFARPTRQGQGTSYFIKPVRDTHPDVAGVSLRR